MALKKINSYFLPTFIFFHTTYKKNDAILFYIRNVYILVLRIVFHKFRYLQLFFKEKIRYHFRSRAIKMIFGQMCRISLKKQTPRETLGRPTHQFRIIRAQTIRIPCCFLPL